MHLKKKGIILTDYKTYAYMLHIGLICEANKYSRNKKRSVKQYKSIKGKFSNLVCSNFNANFPNQLWSMDEYEIDTPADKVFGVDIIDAHGRFCVTSEFGYSRDRWLAIKTLDKAISMHGDFTINGLILHTDRAKIYESEEFAEFAKEKGIIQSMNNSPAATQNNLVENLHGVWRTEYLRHLPFEQRNLKTIKTFMFRSVSHYNYIRLQPCLNEFAPYEVRYN